MQEGTNWGKNGKNRSEREKKEIKVENTQEKNARVAKGFTSH
jgi:hypothetical protein